MDKWLPSRKTVLFFGAIIILLGLFFVLKNTNNIFYKSNLKEDNNISEKISNSDFDNDGLKNWEENLWKTDPNNPDTDGDGTDDNDEILQKRNPLVAGPDDKLEDNISVRNNILSKNLTTTEKISQDLIGGYLTLKTTGEFDQQKQKDLLNSVLDNTISNDQVDKYFLNNIQTTQDNSIDSLQEYSDNLMKILKENSNYENDLIILKRALDNNNKFELDKLNISINFYKKIQSEMLKIIVPSEIKENHLNILNLFNKIENNVKNMMSLFDDPINVLVVLSQYKENEENIMKEFGVLWGYLKNKNVVVIF